MGSQMLLLSTAQLPGFYMTFTIKNNQNAQIIKPATQFIKNDIKAIKQYKAMYPANVEIASSKTALECIYKIVFAEKRCRCQDSLCGLGVGKAVQETYCQPWLICNLTLRNSWKSFVVVASVAVISHDACRGNTRWLALLLAQCVGVYVLILSMTLILCVMRISNL